MNTFEAAVQLRQAGYAVHWLRPRSKAPLNEGWSTAPVATIDDLKRTWRPSYNVGVRCGVWSTPLPDHGLVVLDVDIHLPESEEEALAAAAHLVGDVECPIVRSGGGNGSRHLWFACPNDFLPPKSAITLQAGNSWKLELLSTGKNLVVPPSIHPDTGHAYRWLAHLDHLAPVLPDAVHDAVAAALATSIRPHEPARGAVVRAGNRPGDDFNRRADWCAILEPHGWVPVRQRGDVTDWRRPGKSAGISATTNYGGTGLLYVFSSSAEPLEASAAYSPFGAYQLSAEDHGCQPVGECRN